jgi:mannose-1-phosphate guanylyltransferase/phosphomannomutase
VIEQVVIIAGGLGTRMTTHTNLPKSLNLIAGKTLLERQIEFFYGKKITNFLLLLGNLSEPIIKASEQLEKKFPIRISYIVEETQLGTGGALLNAIPQLAQEFILIHGDIAINTEITELVKSVTEDDWDFALLYHPSNHPSDSDLLALNENQQVIGFFQKPRLAGDYRNQANSGVYAFRLEVVKKSQQMLKEKNARNCDLDRDLIPYLLSKGSRIKGIRNLGFVRDCGTRERLEFVSENWNELQNPVATKPAVFLDRDGTLNHLNGFITHPDQLRLVDDAEIFVKSLNAMEFWVIVVTNQPVIARGEVTRLELDQIHAKIEAKVALKGGRIDHFLYCPHHPEKGFPGEKLELKIVCACRKPEPALIFKAQEIFPIDMERSWMIGDTWRDIELAQRVGIRSILIGEKKKGFKEDQFFASNLLAALRIIQESEI